MQQEFTIQIKRKNEKKRKIEIQNRHRNEKVNQTTLKTTYPQHSVEILDLFSVQWILDIRMSRNLLVVVMRFATSIRRSLQCAAIESAGHSCTLEYRQWGCAGHVCVSMKPSGKKWYSIKGLLKTRIYLVIRCCGHGMQWNRSKVYRAAK